MESNPLAPRQRNRRSDRQAEPAPTQQPVQQTYQQPVYPPQQMYQQQPRAMYQQPYQQAQTNQPMQPTAAGYPPMQPFIQQGYPQSSPPPQTRQTPMPVQSQAAPRPSVLKQAEPVNSGWQQPTLREYAEIPHARASRGLLRDAARADKAPPHKAKDKTRRDSDKPDAKPAKRSVSGWLTGATTACFLVLLALAAAYWLMQAYLTTEENERIAAHEALLEQYHVTEQADGSLNVTWQALIEKYAAQYNLQPAFVTAIIRNESSFRTNAESSVGARGLMQLMPDTAEWISRKLDDSAYSFDRMWDAETNIRYGCWYLGYLSRLFHGDAELVSGAYHAGQTTITQWLSDRTKSADGVTLDLENLSDGPTKQYIGRVTQTYGIYQSLLYPDEAFGAAGAVSAGGGDAPADAR